MQALKSNQLRFLASQKTGFQDLCALKQARLVEVSASAPGQEAAALGFAFAWALAGQSEGLIFWASSRRGLIESGLPHAEGLAQFGVDLDRLLLACTHTQADALWACEQALTLKGACVLCTIPPAASARDALSLTATRRLLLAAERHDSRCILLRQDAAQASAAWLRWSVAAAPCDGEARELGAPAFHARLTRNRAGPTGQSWRLEWTPHDHVFRVAPLTDGAEPALDDDLAAGPRDRPAETGRARAS